MTHEEKRKKRELRFALTTADKISFNAFDEFGEIIEDEFGPNAIKLHQTKCKDLVTKILGPHFKDELDQDLQHEDAIWSILADEATDISVIKFLTISVRYYSPKYQKIIETHLDIREIIGTTAEDVTDVTGNLFSQYS